MSALEEPTNVLPTVTVGACVGGEAVVLVVVVAAVGSGTQTGQLLGTPAANAVTP